VHQLINKIGFSANTGQPINQKMYQSQNEELILENVEKHYSRTSRKPFV
jgi:hypothetical protein